MVRTAKPSSTRPPRFERIPSCMPPCEATQRCSDSWDMTTGIGRTRSRSFSTGTWASSSAPTTMMILQRPFGGTDFGDSMRCLGAVRALASGEVLAKRLSDAHGILRSCQTGTWKTPRQQQQVGPILWGAFENGSSNNMETQQFSEANLRPETQGPLRL